MKAYAISAILKIFAFEIALGRKTDMLPEVNENTKLFFFDSSVWSHEISLYMCSHAQKEHHIFIKFKTPIR